MTTPKDEPSEGVSTLFDRLLATIGLQRVIHSPSPEGSEAQRLAQRLPTESPPSSAPPPVPHIAQELVKRATADLVDLVDFSLSPEEKAQRRKSRAAKIQTVENHIEALHLYNAGRLRLTNDLNQMKAAAPEAAATEDHLNDFADESLSDLSDELKLFVAAENARLREQALTDTAPFIDAINLTSASPVPKTFYEPKKIILGLVGMALVILVTIWLISQIYGGVIFLIGFIVPAFIFFGLNPFMEGIGEW